MAPTRPDTPRVIFLTLGVDVGAWVTGRVAAVAMGMEATTEAAVTARVWRLDQRWTLFVALVVLNLLDVLTTMWVLDRGGSETNPFIEPIVDSMWTVTALKAGVLAIVGLLLARCRESRPIDLALVGVTGWYIAVVAWNVTVLTVL